MTESHPPAGHPGAEVLSAHLEGLLHPSEAAAVEAHVAGCAACRGRRAGLVDVRVALAALDVDRMPDAVADRLEATLLTERTVPPGAQSATDGVERAAVPTGRHRYRRPAWLLAGGVAAALAGLVLVGVQTWDATTSRDDSTGAAARSTHEVTASGTAYTSADLEDQVRRLLSGGVPAQAESRGEAAPSDDTAEESSSETSPGGTPTTPPALDACVDRLAGAGGEPLAIDTGTFAGSPATVVVLPEPSDAGSVVVWVVGPTCPAEDALLYRHRMPR